MVNFIKYIKYNNNISFVFLITLVIYIYYSYFHSYLFLFFSFLLLITLFFYKLRSYFIMLFMKSSVLFCFVITLLILFSIFYETMNFFTEVSIVEFLFGTEWKTSAFLRNDKIVDHVFGILPLINGTIMITLIAVFISLPISFFSSIYMTIYMSNKMRFIAQVMMNIMAGIPTVVYGYFAINYMVDPINNFFNMLNITIHPDNGLISGIAVSMMLIPTTISLLNSVILSSPKNIVYASLALGATKIESFVKVTLPTCYSGIISAILISISRVLGETMIVIMLASIVPNLSINPLDFFTTVTIQIATIVTGDQGFMNIETLSSYALSFYLFVLTWIINAFAVISFNKYKRKSSVCQ